TDRPDRWRTPKILNQRRARRTITAGLWLLAGALLAASVLPSAADICKREGSLVTCDDGCVGTFAGDATIWMRHHFPRRQPAPRASSSATALPSTSARRIRRQGQRRGAAEEFQRAE